MSRRYTLWMIGALAAWLLASPVSAETIQLTSGTDYAPYVDPTLPMGGVVSEIVQQAFAAQGIDSNVEFLPWKRGYEAVKEGRFAATYPYVSTPDRRTEMLYSDPIYAVPSLLVFRKGHERPFSGPQSLKGLTMCDPLGFALPASLAPAIRAGDIKVERPMQLQLCAQMMARDRVDFLLASPCTYKYVVEPAVEMETVLGHEIVEANPLFLLMPRDNPHAADLIASFNKGLAQLKASGEWTRIVESRLGPGGLQCAVPPTKR